MWGEPIHNGILDRACGQRLYHDDIVILKQASKEADTRKYQKTELSYRHAMGGSEKDYNNFIRGQFVKALKARDRNKGLEELGYAFHAIMDNSSPTHKGFQIWEGFVSINAIEHYNGEKWNAYVDPNNQPDIILAMQQMNELYVAFESNYGRTNLLEEISITAESKRTKDFKKWATEGKQSLQEWLDSKTHPDRLYSGETGYRCSYWDTYDTLKNW